LADAPDHPVLKYGVVFFVSRKVYKIMDTKNNQIEAPESAGGLRQAMNKILCLLYLYEKGRIPRTALWKELLIHITPEDAQKIYGLSGKYH